LELYYDLGYPFGVAQALNTTGELLLKSVLISDARASHEKARTTAIALKCPHEEARALEGIGLCHLRDGRSFDGMQSLREAMVIYRKVGSLGAKRVRDILDDRGT
jgi:hypothetical protein